MSITYTCNLCGEPIDRSDPMVVLNGDGERSSGHWRTGWVGHYHADPDVGCWQRLLDMIRAADGRAPRLDTIPTASAESIADARARYRRGDEPGSGSGDGLPTDDPERAEGGDVQG